MPDIILTCNSITVMRISSHFMARRKEIFNIPFSIAPCYRHTVMISFPRSHGIIQCFMRFLRTFFRYYINDPTSSIRSVGRSTRSFNHFNLFDIIHTYNLVDIHCCFRPRTRIGRHCSAGIVIHAPSINK